MIKDEIVGFEGYPESGNRRKELDARISFAFRDISKPRTLSYQLL